jgi:hypothetical protein
MTLSSVDISMAKKLSLFHDEYANLENDSKIEKRVPFSTLQYSNEDVNRV